MKYSLAAAKKKNLTLLLGDAVLNTFKIDDTDFGIGDVICKIENGTIVDLTITGNKKTTRSISNDESSKWSWIFGPPIVFFRGVPFERENNRMEITDELLDEYDISFYLYEHHDIYGTLTINDDHIKISGEIRYHMESAKLYSIEIMAERAS